MSQSFVETALTGKQDTWICFLSIWNELCTLIFPGTLAYSFLVLFWLSSSTNKGCCWSSTSHKQLFQHFSLFPKTRDTFVMNLMLMRCFWITFFFPKLQQYWAALAYWHLRMFLVFHQLSLKVVIPVLFAIIYLFFVKSWQLFSHWWFAFLWSINCLYSTRLHHVYLTYFTTPHASISPEEQFSSMPHHAMP